MDLGASESLMEFITAFEPRHGESVRMSVVAPVFRVTAPNPGPFTFHGTNSYLVGTERLVIIDPGPDDDRHLQALLAAIGGRPVEAILVTHTHSDHSPLAARLAALTGALVAGCAPHAPFRALAAGEHNVLDAAGDRAFAPARVLEDGDLVETGAGTFSVVATPGHTANHLCFALEGSDILFSGDHVMGWSTSIVAPPDGAMAPYMASLERLQGRADTIYLPGHGGAIGDPGRFVRGLLGHRRMRSRAIAERLGKEGMTIPQLVAALYAGLDARLAGAASLNVLAHLEELIERGEARCEGPPMLGSRFFSGG
jgi:glyoxylase-like metal-dependent hydrolase (beta-lactamase superfamily II)